MKSKESQVAAQVRLNQWALEIQDCLNRPKNMTVDEWCEQHNIKKANYYWRLRRVRQACLEQTEKSAGNFVELPAPVQITTDNNSPIAAVIHVTNGFSVEIRDGATAEFIKNLIGALSNV